MPKLNTDHYTREEMTRRRWIFDKVEKYVMQSGQNQDLYGLFDYLAMCPEQRVIIGVQSTIRNELGRHKVKMTQEHGERLRLWLECGGAAVLWGWYRGTDGKARGHNVYRKPPGDHHGNQTVFLWEWEMTLRELHAGPDPILDAGSL